MPEYQKRALVVGGADVSLANPLPVTSEAGVECSTATGGTVNTLIDTTRGWQLHIFEDAIVEVEIGGIQYTREIDDNTANTLDFTTNPLPVAPVLGSPYCIKRMVSPMSPLSRAILHNVVPPYVATADILGADLVPLNTPCLFRLTAGFSVAGILSVDVTRVVGGTVNQQFNHGVVLVANALFMFDHLVHAGDTINYQYSVNCTIQTFRVQEIIAATQ